MKDIYSVTAQFYLHCTIRFLDYTIPALYSSAKPWLLMMLARSLYSL